MPIRLTLEFRLQDSEAQGHGYKIVMQVQALQKLHSVYPHNTLNVFLRMLLSQAIGLYRTIKVMNVSILKTAFRIIAQNTVIIIYRVYSQGPYHNPKIYFVIM